MTRLDLDFFARAGVLEKRCRLFRAAGVAGLLPFFFIAACLEPVPSYQKTYLETSATNLRHVTVAPIAERHGQILRTLLEERLATAGRKLRKTHEIETSLSVNKSARDFGRARIVGEMRATARFMLREKRSKEPQIMLQGSVTERSAYTVRSEFLARRDAEEEALRHVLALVADEMLLRLRLYFFTQASEEQALKEKTSQP